MWTGAWGRTCCLRRRISFQITIVSSKNFYIFHLIWPWILEIVVDCAEVVLQSPRIQLVPFTNLGCWFSSIGSFRCGGCLVEVEHTDAIIVVVLIVQPVKVKLNHRNFYHLHFAIFSIQVVEGPEDCPNCPNCWLRLFSCCFPRSLSVFRSPPEEHGQYF